MFGELQAGSFLFMDADYARNERDAAQPVFDHALFVKTQVISAHADHAVCDAGHKSVSADAGVPTCRVLGHTELTPLKPSEEHLPVEIAAGSPVPAIGSQLYLLPRHVCPSVNNFDDALIVQGGKIVRLERVTARGHEAPILK